MYSSILYRHAPPPPKKKKNVGKDTNINNRCGLELKYNVSPHGFLFLSSKYFPVLSRG